MKKNREKWITMTATLISLVASLIVIWKFIIVPYMRIIAIDEIQKANNNIRNELNNIQGRLNEIKLLAKQNNNLINKNTEWIMFLLGRSTRRMVGEFLKNYTFKAKKKILVPLYGKYGKIAM